MFLDVQIILIVNLLYYLYDYFVTLSCKDKNFNKKWDYNKKNDASEYIYWVNLMKKYWNKLIEKYD